MRRYAPVLGLVCGMLFILLYATLPSVKMNRNLLRVREQRIEEIDRLKKAASQLNHLQEALETDPITIENHLRRRFNSAKGEGEVEVDRLAP